MKVLFLPAIFLMILSACNNQGNKVFKNVSEPFLPSQVIVNGNSNYLLQSRQFSTKKSQPGKLDADAVNHKNLFDELSKSLVLFGQNRERGQQKICEDFWQSMNEKENIRDSSDIIPWTRATKELFLITGEPFYIDEIEENLTEFNNPVSDTLNGSGNNLYQLVLNEIIPVIFTKDVDNIFVNLFYESSIEYNHSLGGKIKIEQKTNTNKKGELNIAFDTEEKQYVELNIRIPKWVSKAEVNIGRVKYVAIPGEYCKIAKKWSNGDQVDIRFLMFNKM